MAQANVTVGIKSSVFKQGLDDMRSQAQQWGGDIKSSIAGAFALGAVVSFVSGFVTQMARVKDLADRLGESSDSIQRVGNAAKLSGSDLEFVIKNLSKMAAAAAEGSDKFEAVGISSAAFANASTEDRILMLAKAFDECNGSQAEMAKLMDLLGPKGQDMLIMISQGAEALNKQMRELPIVAATSVQAMAAFDDTMDKSKQLAYEWAGSVVGLIQHAISAIAALGELMAEGGSFSENYRKMLEDIQGGDKPTGGNKKDITDKDKVKDKEDADKSAKRLEEEMLKLSRSRMDAEEKLASLKKEQAKYAADAEDKSKSDAERNEAKVKDLQIQQEIESATADIAKKKKAEEDKVNSSKNAVEEEALNLARSRMNAEQKIADLKREQAEFAAAAQDGSKTEEERAKAAKRVLEIQQEIESQQKVIDKNKKDKAEKEAKDAEEKAKDTAKAQADLADEERAQKLEKMGPDERIKELKKEQKKLNDEANKESDPQKKAEKKLEALKLNNPIDAAMKEKGDGNKSQPSVISSSLASIGGGGGAYVGTDPALSESRKQTSLLQQIARGLNGAGVTHFSPPKTPF